MGDHRDWVLRAVAVQRVARTPWGRFWIALVAMLLGLKPRMPRLGRLSLPVRLPTGQWVRVADVSELRVIGEIFLDRIYDVPALPSSARVILDMGANIGAASAFFAERYPAARIIAYEADPLVASRARRGLRRLGVDVRAAAVGDREAPVELRRATGASWATSAYAETGDAFITPGVTLDSIIGDQRVDILKLDIEGAESDALGACTRLSQVDVILGELHRVGSTADEFFGMLGQFEILSRGGDERATFVARRRQ